MGSRRIFARALGKQRDLGGGYPLIVGPTGLPVKKRQRAKAKILVFDGFSSKNRQILAFWPLRVAVFACTARKMATGKGQNDRFWPKKAKIGPFWPLPVALFRPYAQLCAASCSPTWLPSIARRAFAALRAMGTSLQCVNKFAHLR